MNILIFIDRNQVKDEFSVMVPAPRDIANNFELDFHGNFDLDKTMENLLSEEEIKSKKFIFVHAPLANEMNIKKGDIVSAKVEEGSLLLGSCVGSYHHIVDFGDNVESATFHYINKFQDFPKKEEEND